MNETRLNVVKQAFQLLDQEGKGMIPLDFLKKKFCSSGHPRVRNREKAPETVQKDFEEAINTRAYQIQKKYIESKG